MSREYDRMNPEIDELLARLEVYSEIDHGKEAYGLSTAEAAILVKNYDRLTDVIYKLNKKLSEVKE